MSHSPSDEVDFHLKIENEMHEDFNSYQFENKAIEDDEEEKFLIPACVHQQLVLKDLELIKIITFYIHKLILCFSQRNKLLIIGRFETY